jgi:superfamily II DNA or RNA helicase
MAPPERRVLTGLTATPQRRDGHHPIITMQCGPIRHTLCRSEQIETATRRVLITRYSGFDPNQLPVDPDIQEILRAVAADDARTRRIATDVVAELTEDRFPRSPSAANASTRSPNSSRL